MRRVSLAALVLATGAANHTATAQGLAESVLTATITQSLEADSNYDLDDPSPGTTILGDTRFELSLEQESENHKLLLGFDTGLRAIDRADEPFEFTLASPTGALIDYEFEGPRAAFDALVRYRQRRTSFQRDIEDPGDVSDDFTEDDLTEDDDRNSDTREMRVDADVGIQFGVDAPSSYALRFTGTDISYVDNGGNLVPRTFGEITGEWVLRINPVLATIVSGSYFYYDADNDADTQIRVAEADAGFIYTPDENLRLRAGIGYADRLREDRDGAGVRETTDDETGVVLRGDFRYIQEDITITGDGRLTTAAPENRFSFNLRGNYALARGRLRGRIFNRFTGDSGSGNESRVTGASLGVERDINRISRLGLDFAIAHQEDLDDEDEPDITRTTVTARYSRDITETITAQVGYRFRSRIEDPDDAEGHRVFFSIGKTFQTNL